MSGFDGQRRPRVANTSATAAGTSVAGEHAAANSSAVRGGMNWMHAYMNQTHAYSRIRIRIDDQRNIRRAIYRAVAIYSRLAQSRANGTSRRNSAAAARLRGGPAARLPPVPARLALRAASARRPGGDSVAELTLDHADPHMDNRGWDGCYPEARRSAQVSCFDDCPCRTAWKPRLG